MTVAQVPWARHAAGHTHAFDQQVAWLATGSSKTAVTELMRIAWLTVGNIVARVWADAEKLTDRFEGLRRIGVDEISDKKGHKYLLAVVDHDTKHLVWAARAERWTRYASSLISLGLTGERRSCMFQQAPGDLTDGQLPPWLGS